MRILIAPDKYRGSLTAAEAARSIARGVGRAASAAVVDLAPLADGGEGLVDTLLAASGGTWYEAIVPGPLGDPVGARYARIGDGTTAVVEMASASGLSLLTDDRRDPTRTSTRGTGDLIRAALELGVSRLIVGIGGSATNDGGAGMAQALGFRLLDRFGGEIGPGGGSLADLDRIDASTVTPITARIEVASDVANPLTGPTGASVIYGPQKGASSDQVRQLDANLVHFAQIIHRDLGVDIRAVPGGGAAGGLGAGLIAFLDATLRPGIDLVMDVVGLANRLHRADLCITGEGCLDSSTAAGKTVAGVARLARSLGVPTIALAGTVGPGVEAVGLDAWFSICPGPCTLATAMNQADAWLADAAEQATRAFLLGRRETDT